MKSQIINFRDSSIILTGKFSSKEIKAVTKLLSEFYDVEIVADNFVEIQNKISKIMKNTLVNIIFGCGIQIIKLKN